MKGANNHDYLTLLGSYQLHERRRKAWAARVRECVIKNFWAGLLVLIVTVLFWWFTGSVWIHWLAFGCPC